jgi:hypothetical protein
MYRGESPNSLSFHEGAVADPGHENYAWEEIKQQGQKLLISDPGAGVGMRIVAMQRHGTHVDIWSDHEREFLIDVALSLRPAAEVLGKKS